MTTSVVEVEPRAMAVVITDDELTVRLVDGRRISTPLVWYSRLLHATPAQRENWAKAKEFTGLR